MGLILSLDAAIEAHPICLPAEAAVIATAELVEALYLILRLST